MRYFMSPRADTVVPLEPGQTFETMPVEVGFEVEVDEVEEAVVEEAVPVDASVDGVCVVDGDEEETAPPAVGLAAAVGAANHQLLATPT
jgi:methylmalonyl-CoA mutase cobalamin-binding subunit